MTDWFEVHSLLVRYATSLDACDVEGVVDCFTPDGWLDSPVLGRFDGHAGVREFVGRTITVRDERGGQFRHVISNLRVETEDGRGRAKCYLQDYLTVGGITELLSPGEYSCDLVRRDGAWKLASRTVRMDRVFAPPDSIR
jgi:hypothetical protein